MSCCIFRNDTRKYQNNRKKCNNEIVKEWIKDNSREETIH